MDIIGVGYTCVDLLVELDELPQSNTSIRMRNFSRQGGGKVATGVVAAARLGAATGIISQVGDDDFGRFCYDDYVYNGVDVRYMILNPEIETGFAVVLSDQKTRGRSILFNGFDNKGPPFLMDDMEEYVKSARILHLADDTVDSRKALRWAKEAGMTVVYDADRTSAAFEEMLPHIDALVASEYYQKLIYPDKTYEEACRHIVSQTGGIAVITLGSRGSVGYSAKTGYFEEPTFDGPVNCTCGAGDVYHGAFCYGLAQGWDARQCARFSNGVSTIKCSRLGGRAALPTRDMVDSLLNTGEYDEQDIPERVERYRKISQTY